METSTDALGVRMCHKLTRDHIWLTSFTRMRVYLAAQVGLIVLATIVTYVFFLQVMSESVASALQIINESGTRETRLFIRMIDKFLTISMSRVLYFHSSKERIVLHHTSLLQMKDSRLIFKG